MIISPCPKCGSLKCSMSVLKYESRNETNDLLNGQWPCEFTTQKREYLAMLLKRMPDKSKPDIWTQKFVNVDMWTQEFENEWPVKDK